MRVLLISHSYIVRVNQNKLHELAALTGLELRVIVPQFWREGLHGVLKVEPPLEVKSNAHFDFLSIPTIVLGRGPRYVHRSLDLTIRQFRPDIICVEEGWRGLIMLQVALYKRLWARRARLVFFTWENVFRPLPRLLNFIALYNLRHINHGICGNEDGVAVAREGGYRGPLSVETQLGVDTEVCSVKSNPSLRERLGLSPETFVIGFAARLVPEKGAVLLVEAVAKANFQGDWKLLIIGSGSERDTILERANELGIQESLLMVATVPHSELVGYYNVMNVLVSSSVSTNSWKEQFGLVVAQAMACGVPVVGSTCGETPYLIGDGGLTFPEGDVDALAQRLQLLKNDRALSADLAYRGRERIVTQYSFPVVAQRTYQIWKDILHA